MADAFAVRSGEGEPRWWLGALAMIKATGADTGGHLTVVEVTDPPGLEAPLHVHHKEDEAFWVLEGDVTFEVGGKTIQAGAGTLSRPARCPTPLQGRRRRLPDALHAYPGRLRRSGQGDKRPGPQPHAPPGRPSDARRGTDDRRTSRRRLRARSAEASQTDQSGPFPCGCHLRGRGLVGVLVPDSREALAVELVKADGVGLVGDQGVEDGPDERQAALLAGEAAHHLVRPFDLAERPFEQIG